MIRLNKDFCSRSCQLKITTLVLSLTLAFVTSAQEASPEDNAKLRNRMDFFTGSLDVSIAAGLIPFDPVSRPGEILEFGSNLALKTIPPVLVIPEDKYYIPDSDDGCKKEFELPQTTDEYDNWFGFWEITKLSEDWGSLGQPSVYHSNTSVELTVSLNGDLDDNATSVSFAEGTSSAYWKATTQISPFWDVALPLYLMLPNSSIEVKYAESFIKKLAKAPAKKASTLKKALVQVAERIGKSAGLQTTSYLTNGLLSDSQPTVSNAALQTITVYDLHTPIITTEQPEIVLEARNFGGSFFSQAKEQLLTTLTYYDECQRPVRLISDAPTLLPFGKTEITWTVTDDGEYLSGVSDRASITQTVDVQDTQAPILVPPSGVALYSDSIIDVVEGEIDFGKVLVADLADPTPTVTRDLPDQLEPGFRYFVTYSASDDSGNVTTAPEDDPEKYSQIITIKEPGTNTQPSAIEKSVNTLTSTPVTILLEGEDTDSLPFANIDESRTDPLGFRIAERPGRGEFVAPLYPYFIEDFRPQPTDIITNDVDFETLACATDLNDSRALEASLGLLERQYHDDYVERCYCYRAGAPVPGGFVYQPRYIHITDDNEYFVSDSYWFCTNDPSGSTNERISKFIDGELIKEVQNSTAGFDGVFQVDEDKNLWWTDLNSSGSSQRATIIGLDQNLNTIQHAPKGARFDYATLNADDDGFQIDNRNLVNTHVDAKQKVVYINDKKRIYMFDYDDPSIYYGAIKQGETFLDDCRGFSGASKGGYWMDTDSNGNLYQVCASRVHKIGPPKMLNDTKTPGDYIGWMGKCTANKIDPDTEVPYSFCDEDTQTSKGFQCTDETCERPANNADQFGSGPGQFSSLAHLDIDMNDIIYVVDYGNSRIQRFAPDGTYAGEAKSTGDGVTIDGSFVLGNMGQPRHVSVNSTEFHVLESNNNNSADYFLHIFKTLPFYDITDSSVKVDYVSEFNFQGTDSFKYLVDDGIDKSEMVEVSIEVDRAFRAPENLRVVCYDTDDFNAEKACQVDEDTTLYLRLLADDIDGFVGFGGLDRLTFSILEKPGQGQLEALDKQVSYANFSYQPNDNYFGSDTFTFQVSDGEDVAELAGIANFDVLPISDPVQLDFPEDISVARGFSKSFQFEFDDVDQDSFPQPEVLSVDWGDGVEATEDNDWDGIGVVDENADAVYPQHNTLSGKGIIIGAHSFNQDVSGIEVCMDDGEQGTVCDSSLAVDVVETTNVSLTRVTEEPIEPDSFFTFSVLLINQKPDYWDGLVARNVTVTFTLPDGVSAILIDNLCTGMTDITCELGDLVIEAQSQLDFELSISASIAQQEQIFPVIFEVTDDGPRLEEVSYFATNINIADDDNDETINFYDDFPQDARYAKDTDFDGIADAWELTYGLSINDPSDQSSDFDGDGATALTEFENDTSPYLADAVFIAQILNVEVLESATDSDLLGLSVASGDINNDGFSDVIAGAPGYGEFGSVFVFFGGASELSSPIALVPDSTQSDFVAPQSYGNHLAVGDLNNDGFADVAVSSEQRVYVFWGGDKDDLGAYFQVPVGADVSSYADDLLIEDANGDEQPDLLIASKVADNGFGENGELLIFLGNTQFWLDDTIEANMRLSNLEYNLMGDSISIGELDGDQLPDIVIGGAFASGVVLVYFGQNIEWNDNLSINPDRELFGNSRDRFGYSVSANNDIDGDGIDDIAIGAYRGANLGQLVVYKSTESFSRLSTISVLGEQPNEQLGVSHTAMPALPFSGTAGYAVGSNRADVDDQLDNGKFQFLFGDDLSNLHQTFYGKAHQMLGYSSTTATDINGDGVSDFIAGAPDISVGSHTGSQGQVYVFFGGKSSSQTDDDLDRVGDDIDNCPEIANSDQKNNDDDALGDLCDPDDDNDTILDTDDAFPFDATESVDTDLDGIGNNQDNDDDEDGMPDSYELTYALNPLDASDASLDSDNDSLSNLEEFRLGTNPNDDDTDSDGITDNIDNNPLVFDQVDQTLYSGQLIILPDLTDDGVKELGVLSINAEASQVELELLNGKSQAAFGVLVWSDIYTDSTLALHLIDDMNANGVNEVGLFGVRDSANNEGRPQMFVRDLATGNRVNVFNWPANWKQTHATVLSDMTGDGIAEIGLQGIFKEGSRPQLVLKNGASTASIDTFGYPNLLIDPQFYQHSDMNNDGVTEISTFGRIARNNKIQIKVASGVDSQDRFKAYNFPDKWADISWLKLDDSNGDDIDDWGLFGTNKQDGRPQLIVKNGTDPKGALRLHAWPAAMQSAQFFAIPDINGDGVDEVAAAGLRTNGRHQFQIQDGVDRNSVLVNYNLNLSLSNVSYHVLPDLTDDGLAEIGFMGVNNAGEYQLIIRDGDINLGEVRVDDLGSDWSQPPAISSLGDSDEDGSPKLLFYGQKSTNTELSILHR